MNVLVLDHQGLGNVITSLPLLERLVARYGPRGVHVLVRPVAADLVRAAGVRAIEAWRGPGSAFAAAHRARSAGARRLLAVPPISMRKVAWLAALAGLERVRPAQVVPLHGAHAIGESMQALADTLELGTLDRPRLPAAWCADPLAGALAGPAARWDAAPARLAVHLGCDPANDHKRWSVARFRATLEQVCAAHPDACVAVLGTERELAASLAHEGSSRLRAALLDLTGRANLRESARFLAAADALLSADSGLMHLAAALDVTIFAVFGPTSAECWFPSTADGRAFAARLCPGPCYPRVPAHCRRARCVDGVAADEVAAALLERLSARGPLPREALAA